MPHTPIGRLTILLAAVATGCGATVAIAQRGADFGTEPPHVILVMADDLGWGQTSYYGHPLLETPNLDAMADNGLRLDRFYAGAPSYTPTRASVLTGRNNDRTGAVRVPGPINKQEKMMPVAFQNAGYATAHFGKWHLNGLHARPGLPILKEDPYHPGELGFDYWLSCSNNFDRDPILSRNGDIEEFEGDSSEILVEEALSFIERETAQDKRVFVVIWYSSPHRPLAASEEDAKPFSHLDPGSRDHHGEIVAMDRSIGALRSGLRDLGIAENTLVWFKSDNGGLPDIDYGPGYGPIVPDTTGHLRGFKKDSYEGGLRVPALIEWPERIQPRITHYPTSTMDIFPTLIEVAGLDPRRLPRTVPIHRQSIALIPTTSIGATPISTPICRETLSLSAPASHLRTPIASQRERPFERPAARKYGFAAHSTF